MIPKRPRRVDLEFVCVFGHECVQRRLACSVGESPTRVKVSTCAPQKVYPALIARFRLAMAGCFWPIFFFADHRGQVILP